MYGMCWTFSSYCKTGLLSELFLVFFHVRHKHISAGSAHADLRAGARGEHTTGMPELLDVSQLGSGHRLAVKLSRVLPFPEPYTA